MKTTKKLLKHSKKTGFTLVEILVVIVVIGTLTAGIIYVGSAGKSRQRAYYVRSLAEFNAMANALVLYRVQYNDYPEDVTRGIPAGLKEFIKTNVNNSWPTAPYPGGVYDYENWPPDGNGPLQTYQISIRLCNSGDDATCKANAKKYLKGYVSDSVLDNWDSLSSVYYCIKGSCRSHQSKPISWPGFCVNCGGKSKVF